MGVGVTGARAVGPRPPAVISRGAVHHSAQVVVGGSACVAESVVCGVDSAGRGTRTRVRARGATSLNREVADVLGGVNVARASAYLVEPGSIALPVAKDEDHAGGDSVGHSSSVAAARSSHSFGLAILGEGCDEAVEVVASIFDEVDLDVVRLLSVDGKPISRAVPIAAELLSGVESA